MMQTFNVSRMADYPEIAIVTHSKPESDRALEAATNLGLAYEPFAVCVAPEDDSCSYAIAQRGLKLDFPQLWKDLAADEENTWTLRDGVIYGDASQIPQVALLLMLKTRQEESRIKARSLN